MMRGSGGTRTFLRDGIDEAQHELYHCKFYNILRFANLSKVEEVVIRADQVDEVGVTEDIWLVRFIAKVLQIINAPLFKST